MSLPTRYGRAFRSAAQQRAVMASLAARGLLKNVSNVAAQHIQNRIIKRYKRYVGDIKPTAMEAPATPEGVKVLVRKRGQPLAKRILEELEGSKRAGAFVSEAAYPGLVTKKQSIANQRWGNLMKRVVEAEPHPDIEAAHENLVAEALKDPERRARLLRRLERMGSEQKYDTGSVLVHETRETIGRPLEEKLQASAQVKMQRARHGFKGRTVEYDPKLGKIVLPEKGLTSKEKRDLMRVASRQYWLAHHANYRRFDPVHKQLKEEVGDVARRFLSEAPDVIEEEDIWERRSLSPTRLEGGTASGDIIGTRGSSMFPRQMEKVRRASVEATVERPLDWVEEKTRKGAAAWVYQMRPKVAKFIEQKIVKPVVPHIHKTVEKIGPYEEAARRKLYNLLQRRMDPKSKKLRETYRHYRKRRLGY